MSDDVLKPMPCPGVSIMEEWVSPSYCMRGPGWVARRLNQYPHYPPMVQVDFAYHSALDLKIVPRFFLQGRDVEMFLNWLSELLHDETLRSLPEAADACCALHYALSPIHTAGRTSPQHFFAEIASRSTQQSFDLFRIGTHMDDFVVKVYDTQVEMWRHETSIGMFRDIYRRRKSIDFSDRPWTHFAPNYVPHDPLLFIKLTVDTKTVAERQQEKDMQVRDKIKETFGLTKPEGSYDHLHRECSITSLASEIGLNAKDHCSHWWTAFGLAAVAFGASPLDFERGFVKDRDDVKGTFTAKKYRSKVLKAVPNIITREFLEDLLECGVGLGEEQMAEVVEALFMVCHQKAGPAAFTLDMRSILESFLDRCDSLTYEDFVNAHTEVRDPGEERAYDALIEVNHMGRGRTMAQAGVLARALKTGEVRLPKTWAEVHEDVLMASSAHEETSFVDSMPRCLGRGADAEMCSFCGVSDLCRSTRDYGMIANLAERVVDYDWCGVSNHQWAMTCGECPYAKTVGGGYWKPPITDLLRCSVREDFRETSPKHPNDLCDRGHTNRCYLMEKAGDRVIGIDGRHGYALRLHAALRGIDVAAYDGADDEVLRRAIIEKDRPMYEKIATFGRRFGVTASGRLRSREPNLQNIPPSSVEEDTSQFRKRLQEIMRPTIGYGLQGQKEKKA